MRRLGRTERWFAVAGLLFALGLMMWWRGHTFAPTLIAHWPGLKGMWRETSGETEPLDCDEAAYAYIGKRILQGDVLYRDVSENKPPLGYWLYALGVAGGGYEELAFRLLPIPFVAVTLILVWGIVLEAAGGWAAVCAAVVYGVWSCDPYVYGNGAQFEVFQNAFATAGLAAWLAGVRTERRGWWVLAGMAIGCAALVRQVGVVHLAWMVPGAFLVSPRRWRAVGLLLAGVMIVGLVAIAALGVQGCLDAAWEDVVRMGGALARDTPAEANQPSRWVRWLTGNADFRTGALPWPFGKTNYLVWWGTGSWPLWVLAGVGLVWCGIRGGMTGRAAVAFVLASWVGIVAPGLYWQHYYAQAVPGSVLLITWMIVDGVHLVGGSGGAGRRLAGGLVVLGVVCGVIATGVIQAREYLLVPASELARRYKGGGQWIVLRELGRDLKARTRGWEEARLYIWGYQSPMAFYAGMDSVTPDFFANALVKSYSQGGHALVGERLARAMRGVEERRPEFVFAGYAPFPALREWLRENAEMVELSAFGQPLPTGPGGMGLWVRKDRLAAYRAGER